MTKVRYITHRNIIMKPFSFNLNKCLTLVGKLIFLVCNAILLPLITKLTVSHNFFLVICSFSFK
jgi:hypothetical protein